MIKRLLVLSFLVYLVSLNSYAQESEEWGPESVEYMAAMEKESRISRHRDMYFILGSPDTKIQISAKYKMFDKVKLYLAYTQQMFWELGEDSNPFKDVNFNPELFYRFAASNKRCFLRSIDFGVFEHKSNGKAGIDSRSWSRSYVKFNTVITKLGKWTFNWNTKLFLVYKFSLDSSSEDIQNYMGFWETKLSLLNYFDPDEFIDRAEIYFAFNSGGKYSQALRYGSQELGFRLRMGWGEFNPSVFFQIFHGYNESMISYNQTYWAYRTGLAF